MESGSKRGRSYHHGDLRGALLAAAERIVEEKGVQALTLRATARAVGVSHTAPQNHFGDLTGLLSELAAVGYRRFTEALTTAGAAGGEEPRVRNLAVGKAYVAFALAHRGMFALMFRSERLDIHRPALRDAIEASRVALRQTALPGEDRASPLNAAAARAARWGLVHGLAVLISEGRLTALMRTVSDNISPDDFIEAALRNAGMKAQPDGP
ncbi:TetR/AcrR family transcriptional regulator [Pseudochelatococcus contaminans]|uniref:AcrR family transcriptional regulator n=1 Tax=Pseudochelatococcus contaminans TaxID=1538103 RepID=A0A7W5Z5V3_9HYPH|nr:TetR/AcrR family transcriptional regulator [Pseudochelatococcus contaminans]MBB3810569.1 AcrR family transcriptional regulator [Pseudochelatococcus contaminans]